MNNLKSFLAKITSVALAATMTLGLSTGIAAKTFDDIDIKQEYNFAEQIDILSDIGVIVGTSDTKFSPDENVTREQMAMFLFRIMLGRNNPGTVNSSSFNDLYDDVYNGAISWANASGHIIGTSENTFEPTGGITLQDAMTMIIRALGQSTTAMDRGYPWTYIDAAIKTGLDKGLGNINYEATLTRAQTAAILYNALSSEYLMQKTTSNGNTYVEKTTIIEYVFGYDIAECVVAATNTYSINDNSLVIKDGYVTVSYGDKAMTVKFADLGLDGKANDWLGKTIKVIYKTDTVNNTINVLGASYKGASKNADTMTIADNNTFVTIDGVKYNVVEKLSASLATNDNELLVYVYDATGKLVQVKNNADLRNHLGFYNIEMIYDIVDSTTAYRAILKNLKFGKLTYTNDKINLADDLKVDELTGGFDNEIKAENGDYVLYYFNKGNKHLEIAEVLKPTDKVLVSKLSADAATIGNKEYKLGSKASGVESADLNKQIGVGNYVSIIEKNGVVLAIHSAPVTVSDSAYLIAETNSFPSLNTTTGNIQYAFTAIIDGVRKNIVTDTTGITAGNVYRYIKDANNNYVLYPTTSAYFTQTTELSNIAAEVDGDVTLNKGTLPYYSFNGISFVTDANTAIITKNGANYEYKKGTYAAAIEIKDNAQVTAVYKNNTGNIETLLFMYISDGSLSVIDETVQSVKILAKTSDQYDEATGVVYSMYKVYNYNTGKVEENVASLSNALTVGNVYVLDSNNKIANVAASLLKGILTGNTGSTITVNGTVYKLANGAKAVKLNADNTIADVKLDDCKDFTVEFVLSGGEVKSVIVDTTEKVAFTMNFNDETNTIAISTNDKAETFKNAAFTMNKITRDGVELDVEQWIFAKDEAITIKLYNIEAGNYTFTFTYNGVEFAVTGTLPAITPVA